MIFFPFIYFLILTLYWWKKHHGFDICVYMSALYTLVSLFAIFIVVGDLLGDSGILFDSSDVKFGFVPTVLFCLLLTLTILPFSLIHGKILKKIKPTYSFLLNGLCWFLIMIALLNLYLVADSTLEILSGDLSSVRSDHYEGLLSPAQLKAESMPMIIRFLYTFNNSTILALPIMFYFICFEHKPWWFNLSLFFTSLSMPIAGMQTADRTESVFYALMFTFCLVFFKGFISKKLKRLMIVVGLPILSAFVIYFVAVSDARFSEKEGGAATSSFQYAGQGFLNYCFIWENAKPNLISAEREFPFIHHFIFHVDSNPERRAVRSGQQGFFISVFPTFLGDILLDLSLIGLLIWVLYFFLIVFLVIKASKRKEIHAGEMLMIFVLAAIPVFGIFYYRYFNYNSTFIILLAAIIYIMTQIKYINEK